MQIVDAALLDIVDLLLDALEVVGEVVDIQHHTDKIVGAVPKRRALTFSVELFERFTALLIVFIHGARQPVERLHIVIVNLAVEPFELVEAGFKAVCEFLFPLCGMFHPITSLSVGIAGIAPLREVVTLAALLAKTTSSLTSSSLSSEV